MSSLAPGLTDAAKAWRDQDPDTVTQDELDQLIVAAEAAISALLAKIVAAI